MSSQAVAYILCRAKTDTRAQSWYFPAVITCYAALAGQALGDLSPLDPGGHVDGLAGFVQWWSLFPRLMWPVFVVMLRVLSQDLQELLFRVDKQVGRR